MSVIIFEAASYAATDLAGQTTGPNRVLCDGIWVNDANYCRSAFRYYYAPSYFGHGTGFRVLCLP